MSIMNILVTSNQETTELTQNLPYYFKANTDSKGKMNCNSKSNMVDLVKKGGTTKRSNVPFPSPSKQQRDW